MKHSLKLKIQFADLLIDKQQATLLEVHASEEGYGLVRHKLPRRTAYAMLSRLPREVAANCNEINYSLLQGLKPHVHTEDGCVINIYKATGGAQTVFYTWRDEPNAKDVEGKYYTIDESLLSEVESFTAQHDDVWLLNTRQPHAVVGCDGTREVVQMFLGMPFEEAKKRFV
jgi:hypothetical protein